MKNFLSIIIPFLIISCSSTTNKLPIYFGGEIINPKVNYVLLLKDDNVVDTLLLNNENRFMGEFNSLKEGLYTFRHGNEFQYIYLEPSDSVLVRLNTWDFDESLVFSGKGSSKNEFLINLFLQNEKEEKEMYKFFNLNETDFQSKIDSLANERMQIFNEFSTAENYVSSGFNELTKTAIHFPLYRLKEMYPYYHKKALKLEKFPVVSDSFYSFRNKISLDKENLVSFYPYQNYVVSYLYNLSDNLKEKDPSKNNTTVNILNSVIEHIHSEDFKNTLLKKIVVQDFLESSATCSVNEETLAVFLKNCNNVSFVNEVNNLITDSKKVPNDSILKPFELISYTNKTTNITDVINNKNTVIYFWSADYMSSEFLVNRIKYLEHKYPNLLFVGINMKSDIEDITKEPNLKKLEINKQFKLTNTSEAHSFLTSNYPRMITVNKNGIVENGFIHINSKKLHSELKKLEKI
jgi:hypothetical protein